MFSRIAIGFGVALIAVSGLAAALGAVTLSTAIVPAILGLLYLPLGWLGRRPAAQQTARQRSPSLFATILAAALVFSSARGITLVSSALGNGVSPSATGIFLLLMAAAGIGYVIVGMASDIATARRIARARATSPQRRPGR